MKKEELVNKVGSRFLTPIAIVQVLCVLAFLSSPFIWIWYKWTICWQIGLTGLIGIIIAGLIYHFIHKIVEKVVDEKIDCESKKIDSSLFHQRLKQMEEQKSGYGR